ncbi:bifunctional glutamate N-acetyltransferase/amino-acid acetyltransferase ArgJ [Desulfovibrio litoralis]|uniref:Arginine biosynthesis bifunctional protein ArgJ n=1 Tax=Desulfovibrio litoralis DSM 11393 TaxID=1121455 RepID=A0A1M7TA90_9BACT|nr:bifunctional glutamate N-acetyltransferase/amino-acid acetyltransferase ArgJ [Desulfovibrio litoralis]SHN67604.1 glutamate N-acetyltransferase [Desulfovibrio litoralis DSM 11393]
MNKTPTPKGFKFAVHKAYFRKGERNDLALVVSEYPAQVSALFTANLFPAAPVLVAKEYLALNQSVRAVIVNTGSANACTGQEGIDNCKKSTQLIAENLGIKASEVLPASTGVIGLQMDMPGWEKAAPLICQKLGTAELEDFAEATMTTDAFPKFAGMNLKLKNGTVCLAGVAKGAGMICPNMATMLSTVLCDAQIDKKDWDLIFKQAVDQSFNRVSVDGDTSTNDTIYSLVNGASGVKPEKDELELLQNALTKILKELAYLLVKDGEGATKVLFIKVSGTKDNAEAEKVARTVGHSQLVKTAMYGKDANWGRIVAAAGRSGVNFDPNALRLVFCGVELFKNSQPTKLDFDSLLKKPLEETDLMIELFLGDGDGHYELLASDLTHRYIDINADYRS